ncbi:MAG: hypothetical protein IKC05_04540, partial [Lentisphaeria bacterium]|nr:hypothetical protein [Lentisphaeria bacterium]
FIGGSYQKGRRIPNSRYSETDIELLIVHARNGHLQRNVFREKAGHYGEIKFIADQIARKLKLAPQKTNTQVNISRKQETWAVLPFLKLLRISDFNKRTSFFDSDIFLYQLQQTEKIGKLVSRDNIRQILTEQKIHTLSRMDIGIAAGIGRLLAADKIVSGSITNGPGKNLLRLDILVISSRTGAVVNAFTGTFPPADQEKFFASAVRQLLSRSDVTLPENTAVNSQSTETESKRLLAVISSANSYWRSNQVLSEQILSLAESYYLLNARDPWKCLVLCHELTNNLLDHYSPEHWQWHCAAKTQGKVQLRTTEDQSRAMANFLLPVLDTLPDAAKIAEYPDSTGKLRYRLLLNAGRLDEAEEIDRKKLYNTWDITPTYRGVLEIRRKNFKKAGDIYLESGNPQVAMYAYYLGGDKKLAYQTAKQVKPLFLAHTAETIMIYLELLEKFESPESAARWFFACDKYMREKRPDSAGYFRTAKLNPTLAQKVERLRKLTSPMKFSSARTLLSKFTNHPVYFQSLGSVPQKELVQAAKILKENTGLNATILPDKKLPLKGVYNRGLHTFDSEKLCKALRYAWGDNYPRRGLLMLGVTNDAISKNRTKVLYDGEGNISATSVFSRMPIAAELPDFSRTLAVTAARLVFYTAMREPVWCSNYPCLFVAINHFRRCREIDFKICQECLKYAQKANPKRALKRFSNPNWMNYYSEQEKKDFSTYKKEFNK